MEPLTQTHHVFVDFENVHDVDLDVVRHESVIFNLLIGPQKRKLDTDLVEALVHHAASVNLVRMSASGRNALDFALAYYLGRACVSDPRGCFHLISKDTGYDPLLVHLRANNINAQRHNDFSTLPFLSHAKPKPVAVPAAKAKAPARTRAAKTASVPKVSPSPTPVKTAPPKPHPAPKVQAAPPPPQPAKAHPKPAKTAPAASPVPPSEPEDTLTVLALNRLVLNEPHNPKTINRLKSYLKGQLGAKVSEKDADLIIRELTEHGIIALDGSGKVTYHLDPFSEDVAPF